VEAAEDASQFQLAIQLIPFHLYITILITVSFLLFNITAHSLLQNHLYKIMIPVLSTIRAHTSHFLLMHKINKEYLDYKEYNNTQHITERAAQPTNTVMLQQKYRTKHTQLSEQLNQQTQCSCNKKTGQNTTLNNDDDNR
jgi:hypothetical protein